MRNNFLHEMKCIESLNLEEINNKRKSSSKMIILRCGHPPNLIGNSNTYHKRFSKLISQNYSCVNYKKRIFTGRLNTEP